MWAVLDTDCHSWIDSEFEAWNTSEAQIQLRERPHKVPTVSPQSVVSAACSLWEDFPHKRTVEAFKACGLSAAPWTARRTTSSRANKNGFGNTQRLTALGNAIKQRRPWTLSWNSSQIRRK